VRKGRGRERPIQFVDVASIDNANEDVDHPVGASLELCSENGRDLDVTFFPSWLQDTTSKPVEKSWSGLFCRCIPVRTGRYWKEGRNVREEDDGAESGGA